MHRQAHEHDRLDLLDVVGVAGDERRRPEPVDLDLREASRPCAKIAAPDVAPEAHRDPRAEVDRDDRGDAEERR